MHSGSDEPKALFRVNDEVLPRLKHPFGQLVLGSPEKTIPILREIIRKTKPKRVIAVGDVVATNMQSSGLTTDLMVIDRRTMRSREVDFDKTCSLTVRNPQGEISQEAFDALKAATMGNSVRFICVQGEEDLLALPLATLAPIGSIIVYGQPLVGLVIMHITSSVKRDAKRILSKMRVRS